MGTLEAVLAAVDNAKRMVGRNAQDLYNDPAAYADKIVGHLRNTNAGVSPTIAGGELTNRVLSPSERTEQVMGSLDFGGGLGVIKPKGGNWLSGKYGPEAQLKNLRSAPETVAQMAPEVQAQNSALNNFVDNQLTKYVKNDMGAPTDPIRKLADAWQGEKATKLEAAEAKIKALRAKQEAQAATRGVPEEYLTRTRQDVLSAEEARDLIAENTGLHFAPDRWALRPSNVVNEQRASNGFPAEGMAMSDTAKAWENLSDRSLGTGQAKNFQNLPNNLAVDPWLAKTAPEAPIYNFPANAKQDLGFSHLTDELSNSLFEGRLSPEQLSKMPIDQAVRHVAEINALRAVKSKKEQAMEMAGMPIHKDYPEQGMSWRQLRAPELTPERIKQLESEQSKLVDEYGLQHVNSRQLEKWLTQEGDAMGHCVGGYCPDVQSGASSIYSLRDAKGQPHVTIETKPVEFTNDVADGYPEATRIYDDLMAQRIGPQSADINSPEAKAWFRAADEHHDDVLDLGQVEYAKQTKDNPIIAQIKGPKNGAPAAEHLPLIQDFIRSGKWSNIQDAQHTGFSQDEINQLLKGQ